MSLSLKNVKTYFTTSTIVDGKKYETADIGSSLEKVLRYYTIQGKLTQVCENSSVIISKGIHPDLVAIGVKKIEVDFKKGEVAFIFEGIKYFGYKKDKRSLNNQILKLKKERERLPD